MSNIISLEPEKEEEGEGEGEEATKGVIKIKAKLVDVKGEAIEATTRVEAIKTVIKTSEVDPAPILEEPAMEPGE